ncbi:MAG: S8 family serine peptidase [Kiritimatiellia bacterium]
MAYSPLDTSSQATTGAGFPAYNLDSALGANRYTGHTTSITGQNTVTTNLEAGHIWNGHESLSHVSSFTHHSDAFGTTTADLYDRHATWAGMLIGGRQTAGGGIYQQGLAYGTDLRSAALATSWGGNAYALSFGFSYSTVATAFSTAFDTSDVINSSYGFTDAAGANAYTLLSDGAAFAHSTTTHVVSAGNSGPTANTVGSPGSGYNQITVAALAPTDDYNVVASFSSRAPQDFSYYDETGTGVLVSGVRAAVDLAAPGQDIVSAYYDGQSGGNNSTLTGSTAGTGADNLYSSVSGTSFAAPIVAGGAALVTSAAKTLEDLSGNADATQSVVVKSLLLTGADKTDGWDNGQTLTQVNGDAVQVTSQSLDWDAGAGRMNLDRTFDIQVNGQTDVAGFTLGNLGSVDVRGWDYGAVRLGLSNEYILDGTLDGNSTLTSTLSWLRNREWDEVNITVADVAQADLNLSIWQLDDNLDFTTQVARSESQYNTVEHLSFTLPETGRYGIRIEYDANTFDNTVNDVWGSAGIEQTYGLAWDLVVVPEAGVLVMFSALSLALLLGLRRRR